MPGAANQTQRGKMTLGTTAPPVEAAQTVKCWINESDELVTEPATIDGILYADIYSLFPFVGEATQRLARGETVYLRNGIVDAVRLALQKAGS